MINIEALNQSLPAELELAFLPQGLSLCHQQFLPLTVDFLSNQFEYRTHHNPLGELVAKACGAKHQVSILDLTAGLGRDAYLLASLGCQVLMVERQPVMHALLADGLARLHAEKPEIKLELLQGDAKQLMAHQAKHAEVIYIDPMHPERTKSALVKKEMRILRTLVGSDEDKQQLIEQALQIKGKRVVVKWPLKGAPYTSQKPTAVFKGKSTRFDIYL